ncbi:MAG: hypothetical protein ACRDRX_13140 [Pseudonocardiaceae bacterium]
MPERGADPEPRPADEPTARGGPDLLTMVAGLGALGIATTTLIGGITWFPDLDGRWLLAGLALIVGLLLVIGSLRPQRH